MKKIHYLTGLTITIFIGLHLFNHLMSIFGADAHLSFMQQIRPFYRNAIAETMLILAVLLQITTGIFLFAAKRNLKLNFYKKMQLYTGLYLAFFFVIHIGAVMSGRFLLNLDTNLYFGIAGLNTFPLNLFFMPYYSLAILAFFGHLAAIHSYKMKKN